MDVKLADGLAVRDIDWIAILANAFENAIHGCVDSGKMDREISIYIAEKGNKVIIQFCNTSTCDINFRKGLPDKGSGLGVPSIIKTASRYDGQTDFSLKDEKFVTRILLNM